MGTQIQTVQDAREQLAAIDGELEELDVQLVDVNDELGSALVAMRSGDKKAERKAGDLSLKRSEIERTYHNLSLVRGAMAGTVERMEEEERSRVLAVAGSDFERLTGRARELETTLVQQIEAAASTASELRKISVEWTRARNAAAQAGHDVAGVDQPRHPAALFQPGTIDDVRRKVENWQRPEYRAHRGMYVTRRSVGTQPEPKPFLMLDENRLLGTIRQAGEKDGAA